MGTNAVGANVASVRHRKSCHPKQLLKYVMYCKDNKSCDKSCFHSLQKK